MKKKLLFGLIGIMCIGLVGCNRSIIDTTYKFDKAIINIKGEYIEVEIKSWKDYDDTSIQITSKYGVVYLTDIKNVVLIKED